MLGLSGTTKEYHEWDPQPGFAVKYLLDPIRPSNTAFQSKWIEFADTLNGVLACFFLAIPFTASTSFYLWKDSKGPLVYPQTSLTDLWTKAAEEVAQDVSDRIQRRNAPGAGNALTTEEALTIPKLMVLSASLIAVTALGAFIAANLFCHAMRQYKLDDNRDKNKMIKRMLYFFRPTPPLCLSVVSFFWMYVFIKIVRKEFTIGNALYVAVAGCVFNVAWLVIRSVRVYQLHKWSKSDEPDADEKDDADSTSEGSRSQV